MKDIKHFNSVKEMRAFMKGKGEVIKPMEFNEAKVEKPVDTKKPAKKPASKKQTPKKKGGKK